MVIINIETGNINLLLINDKTIQNEILIGISITSYLHYLLNKVIFLI